MSSKNAEYQRKWRNANLEKCRLYYTKYRLTHKEQIEATKKRYRERPEVREAVKERSRIWRLEHCDYHRKKSREWYIANKERAILAGKRRRYLKQYGITLEERNAIFNRNGGMCEICSARPIIHLDHCHSTGRIRGGLCMQCNQALGLI